MAATIGSADAIGCTLSVDSVGAISDAIHRARVDVLVGSPPCQDHFSGRGLNLKGPPGPPSARATARNLDS